MSKTACMRDGKEVYGDKCNNKKKHNDKKLLIIGGVLSSCLIVASFVALFCLQNRPAGKPRDFDTSRDNFHCEISLRRASKTRLFAYRELEAATKGFEEARILVEGLNGAMYEGILFDGSRVAVQKINCENESDVIQVLSEVEVLASVSHPNIACLIGCCVDLPYTPLVVYEYPPNGTLEEHLRHQREAKLGLDWPTRLSIAVETASVLAFLHYEASPPIFHHDLKPGSIFLDGDLSVKLAGFGLQTPKPQDYNFSNGARFRKNDVCDLGLLLLELISGPNYNKPSDLPTLALQKIRNGRLEEIVDPLLCSYHDQQSIESVADLAMRCLLFGGDGKIGIVDVARELGQIGKDQYGVDVGTSSSGGSCNKRGPQETFSNSSLLQMISMSPDSIYLP